MEQTLFSISGTLITVITAVAVVVLGRLVLKKRIKDSRTYPYHRQFFTLTVSLLGLFIAVGLLPLPIEVRTQILSVLGILFSAVIALSSTTLVGNALAGIMIRMMHGFRAGDFVEVENRIGRITDFGIFHTEMQLITRDLVTIPNMYLVQRCVQVTRRGGSFVHVSVAIGYAESHTHVEQSLKQAAESCSLAEPFVFIEELGSYAVRYRLYGLLEETAERLSRQSALHTAVLDVLHTEGIEIASPQLVNRREYQSEHRFTPGEDTIHSPQSEESHKEGEAIEELAFDRAEEAASIEQLRSAQKKLSLELEQLSKSSNGKGIDKQEREQMTARLKRLEEEIQRREEKQEAGRLEEDSSS